MVISVLFLPNNLLKIVLETIFTLGSHLRGSLLEKCLLSHCRLGIDKTPIPNCYYWQLVNILKTIVGSIYINFYRNNNWLQKKSECPALEALSFSTKKECLIKSSCPIFTSSPRRLDFCLCHHDLKRRSKKTKIRVSDVKVILCW